MCTLNQHSNELTKVCATCENKCASSQRPQAKIQLLEPSFELDGLTSLQLALARTLRLIDSSRLRSIGLDD